MFTGLVEETGTVVAIELAERSARLTVQAPLTHQDAHLGDSIAVNGCCLTVVAQQDDRLTFDAVPETLDRTNLGALNVRFAGVILSGRLLLGRDWAGILCRGI